MQKCSRDLAPVPTRTSPCPLPACPAGVTHRLRTVCGIQRSGTWLQAAGLHQQIKHQHRERLARNPDRRFGFHTTADPIDIFVTANRDKLERIGPREQARLVFLKVYTPWPTPRLELARSLLVQPVMTIATIARAMFNADNGIDDDALRVWVEVHSARVHVSLTISTFLYISPSLYTIGTL